MALGAILLGSEELTISLCPVCMRFLRVQNNLEDYVQFQAPPF